MIDHFTREQFELALPRDKNTGEPMCKYSSIEDGEYTWDLPVPNEYFEKDELCIVIRSSVGVDGTSAATGEDSIRCYLWDIKRSRPAASKLNKYTTRSVGWSNRLAVLLRELYKIGRAIKPCYACHEIQMAFKVKKSGPNKGAVFQKCVNEKCHNKELTWITPAKNKHGVPIA